VGSAGPPVSSPYAGNMSRRFAPLTDFLAVVLFVVIGRSSHGHGDTLTGIISTTWPFGVGLMMGWWLVRQRGRPLETPVNGEIVVVVTVIIGMALRVVAGQGTAAAFVLVAWVFLSLFLVGWRLLAQRFLRR
jgi:Protein of unknown function (DUF3054)